MFRNHPGRRSAALVVGTIGAVLAALLWAVTPPMPSKLASYLSSVDLPRGTRLVEVMDFGNPLCFDSCPSVRLRYHVPGTVDEVERALIDAFRSDRWSVERHRFTSRFEAVSEDTRRWQVSPSTPGTSSRASPIRRPSHLPGTWLWR